MSTSGSGNNLQQQSNALQLLQHQTNQQQENENENENNPILTIKLSSNVKEFSHNNEPTTPTSSDQKIQVVTTCPPAPRKPKSVSRGIKRKTPDFERISIDLMVKINAMLAPVGDLDAGNRVKKVKNANVITG